MSTEQRNGDAGLAIASAITDDPLIAFDLVIQQVRCEEGSEIEQKRLNNLALRCILAVAGLDIRDDENVHNKALELLSFQEHLNQRGIVALCFLRLLIEPSMLWLFDMPWRPKIADLMDAQFSSDLYRPFGIDEKSMSHEKISRLAEAVRDHERKFFQALQTLTSLERIITHRTNVMKVFNNKMGRILFHPFLPINIEADLGEVYHRVDNYVEQREGLAVVDAHKSAIDGIREFTTSLEAHDTLYSKWFSTYVARKLEELIERDFANNNAVRPAMVSVQQRDKKYPLHLVGQTITLGLVVSNQGPGYAYDTALTLESDDAIKLCEDRIEIGRLAPLESLPIEIPAEVQQTQIEMLLLCGVSWQDFDHAEQQSDVSFQVKSQPFHVDWDQLARSDPYSLEPVTSELELVGRKDSLNKLIAITQASSIGSVIIKGQKRVGKTSMARVLQSHLNGLHYLVIYLDGGDYTDPSAEVTITRLGSLICKKIISSVPYTRQLVAPEFNAALAPLAEFVDDITIMAPKLRILIILDEFDELPVDLYEKGPLGDAFFLTLRSISSRPNVGFVLVGGEKMNYIEDFQGDKLNKWTVMSVDYFSRESDWADYKELVQRPVIGALEYTEAALVALHTTTSGNPYFTKLICQYVLRTAIKRRDNHITPQEIEYAVESALEEIDRNTFQHFWTDNVWGTEKYAASKSIRRRKILIALSDVLKKKRPAPIESIREHALTLDIASLSADLEEFVGRRILTCESDEAYDFEVPFFYRWLNRRGVHDIIATFSDLDANLRIKQQEEQLKVRSVELVELVREWPSYRGQRIGEDKVRAWLDQFDEVQDQRAMFSLLQGIRFYSSDFVRQKMKEIDGIVRRGLTRHIEPRKLKRSYILVSYLDTPFKSGAQVASIYADEALIYVDNVVEKGKLSAELAARTDIQALVFVDDFVGTGQSAVEYLQELDGELAAVIAERSLKIVFAVVVAFSEGWQRIQELVEDLKMPVQVHACEILDETAKCFSDKSSIFSDSAERERVMKVSMEYGRRLEKNCPLGYGNLGLAVVFERGCPNNSLPVLWSESMSPRWIPLFKRS